MLSLNKSFKTLFDNSYRLRNALKERTKGISNFIKWVEKVFKGNHWLERKKKQLGLEKICYLFYCKSYIYVYIFSKENGMLSNDNIPFNKPKKFFDMSKITRSNPILKRNGGKNNYILIINILQN